MNVDEIYKIQSGSDLMKYKMLVMDMDGTLLSNDKNISERNKQAIKKAADMGVKVAICTGRVFASARVFGDMIGVSTPIIASNGAYIREKDKDEVIYAKPLGEDNARAIAALSHKYGIYSHFFSWDTLYTEEMVYTAAQYNKWNSGLTADRKVKIEIVKRDEWDELFRKNYDSILKCVVADEDIEKLKAMKTEACKYDIEVTSSWYNNFEVMSKGVSKGRAVSVLAGFYNLDRSEVICIGDNDNDISMIEYAGLGIVMKNGTDGAKAKSNFITLSNEEDGVAYAIEKFILNPGM